jgi:hypothetical protein
MSKLWLKFVFTCQYIVQCVNMCTYIYVYAYIYICSKLVWQRRDDYDSKCQVINPQLVQCVFFIQTCRWTITLHFLHLQRCASFCFCFPYVKCNLLLIVPLFPGLKLIDTSNQLGCFVLWIQVYICNHIYIYSYQIVMSILLVCSSCEIHIACDQHVFTCCDSERWGTSHPCSHGTQSISVDDPGSWLCPERESFV